MVGHVFIDTSPQLVLPTAAAALVYGYIIPTSCSKANSVGQTDLKCLLSFPESKLKNRWQHNMHLTSFSVYVANVLTLSYLSCSFT